ncbi:hypothetical protein DFH29DRAFT_890765 [Suillus ampliporus]|nr:hypothetical protein DFH29DRAFT_890765 [Suillus ampliporus]
MARFYLNHFATSLTDVSASLIVKASLFFCMQAADAGRCCPSSVFPFFPCTCAVERVIGRWPVFSLSAGVESCLPCVSRGRYIWLFQLLYVTPTLSACV